MTLGGFWIWLARTADRVDQIYSEDHVVSTLGLYGASHVVAYDDAGNQIGCCWHFWETPRTLEGVDRAIQAEQIYKDSFRKRPSR